MKSFHITVRALMLFSFFLAISARSQNTVTQNYFTANVAVTYSDGEPVDFQGSGADEFDVELSSAPAAYAGYVSGIKDNVITVKCLVDGAYSLKFAGKKITGFNVVKKAGGFKSDLPSTLQLPFNYLIKAPSGSKIPIYDISGKPVGTETCNNDGYLFLNDNKNGITNKFFVCYFDNQFPKVLVFNKTDTRYKNELRARKLIFSANYKSLKDLEKLKLGRNTVVNIDDDIYYKLVTLQFLKEGTLYNWLLVYHATTNKSEAHLLNLHEKANLFLDESGKVIVNTKKPVEGTDKSISVNYYTDAAGNLQPAEDAVVDPCYRFNNHYISGIYWKTQNVANIPLEEGLHTFTVACEGKKGSPVTGTKNVELVFDKAFNRVMYKNTDGKLSTWIEFIDDHEKFSKITVKQCYLTIDGGHKIPYSYKDTDEQLKGLFYSDMSESEKKAAAKSIEENAPVVIGWPPDEEKYTEDINLFQGTDYVNVYGPVNKYVGPYPELRYRAFMADGSYPTHEEAQKHCNKPIRKRSHGKTVYRCMTEHVVKICPDNYNPDAGAKSLFCGEGDENDNNRGDQVVYEISAPGYVSRTGALSKRMLEASEFILSGFVVNEKGGPIKDAKIHFRGKERFVLSDSAGRFVIKTTGEGDKPFKQELTIELKKIGLTIYNEELGKQVSDTFGIVSDGFTTLKFKVSTNGIDPRTVTVKQPDLGSFTEQTMLKLPLVLNDDGTGEMEYVPPEYLTEEQLNKHLKLKADTSGKSRLSPMLWVAEVPVTITYEDEEGNPGSQTVIIYVTRPPVMLVHGFTGDETTWATLANYLRVRKYEPVICEYYKGPIEESTIERQSEKLGKYIRELRSEYLNNHFLQNRVDIVAHSMGGLISRYYISNMAKYGKTAGIYIPYNMKLSGDQIKAARYQKPVILNDVRKLIMVGTPNHGASPIDERIGYWSSKFTGYHQIAGAQLRSDSPFFEKLNAGESEGRHLDPNVQYALIYGIRKRSAFYLPDSWFHTWGTSQKEFASDDGVVTISSAKLNGVIDFPFPKEWYAIHGYIHSPAVQPVFPEDEPITESTDIFEKVDELLNENIPRVPLKNSYAKIIRARGDVRYRYFSTQNWIPLKTPFMAGRAKKLENNWCRIKTGEGSAELGFFLNGHQWGALYIMPNTVAYYEYASPEFVNVYMQQGKARFRSRKREGGSFEIVLGNEGEKWYAFNPKAKVKDLNTDFTVESENGSATVQSIYGMVAVGTGKKNDKKVVEKAIGKKQGVAISGSGAITNFEVPDEGWWSSVDTTFLPDDTAGLVRDSNSYTFDVGPIELTASGSYLPVAGFSTLQLHLSTVPDTLLKAELAVKQQNKIPFIHVTNPDLLMDSLGNAGFNVTIDEPALSDYASLADLPLQVVFKATIMLESTGQVIAEKELSLPVGMTLLTGKTVDAGFKPRKEPSPPELYPVSFQLANQADDKGNFYILFNTTLFDKEIDKLKQYAERTGKPLDKSSLKLLINWSENCSLPLTYELPDSIIKTLKAGVSLSIGRHGNFDLLTPAGHELRIKKYVEEFASEIPLNDEAKSYLFSKLDKLQFNYNVKSISTPTFSDNLTYSGTIDIPVSNKEFWATKINENTDPAYTLIFHVMGHFLQQAVLTNGHRYYNFLAKKCNGSKFLYTRPIDELQYLFDNSAYVSFNEAGADFFTYLLYRFLEKKHPEFITNSIYNHQGYINNLKNNEVINSVQKKYPPWLVSGSQTSFLINYYGDECATKPTAVFSDFLLNSLQFAVLTRGTGPAATINQWILAKHLTYQSKKYAGNTDPNTLAERFSLFDKNGTIELIPRSGFSRASLVIDNNTITDFRQIPAVTIQQGSLVKFGKGHFVLLMPSRDTVPLLEADSTCVIEVEENNRIKLLEGTLYVDAPVGFKTSLADFIPSGNDFQVTVTPKLTTIFNNNGVLKIVSKKDEAIVPAGFATIMSKKGNIKKPKPPKKEVSQRFVKSTAMPFVF